MAHVVVVVTAAVADLAADADDDDDDDDDAVQRARLPLEIKRARDPAPLIGARESREQEADWSARKERGEGAGEEGEEREGARRRRRRRRRRNCDFAPTTIASTADDEEKTSADGKGGGGDGTPAPVAIATVFFPGPFRLRHDRPLPTNERARHMWTTSADDEMERWSDGRTEGRWDGRAEADGSVRFWQSHNTVIKCVLVPSQASRAKLAISVLAASVALGSHFFSPWPMSA